MNHLSEISKYSENEKPLNIAVGNTEASKDFFSLFCPVLIRSPSGHVFQSFSKGCIVSKQNISLPWFLLLGERLLVRQMLHTEFKCVTALCGHLTSNHTDSN